MKYLKKLLAILSWGYWPYLNLALHVLAFICLQLMGPLSMQELWSFNFH